MAKAALKRAARQKAIGQDPLRERKRTWFLEDHLCRGCGGRILKCATGHGATPAGNPVFKCADCGASSCDMGPEGLCWCGFGHKHNHEGSHVCLPFSVLEENPHLKEAFLNCGCDPERGGEVGVVLYSELKRLSEESRNA